MKLTVEDIQQILNIFLDSELRHLHLEIGDVKLAVTKGGADAPAMPVQFSTPAPARASGAVAQAAAAAAPAPGEGAVPASAATAGPPAVAPAAGGASVRSRAGLFEVKAPSLGVFYRRPAPDQPPFVEVGSVVGADDPVCLIEVMKLFNRVSAGAQGRIAEILVEDGKMVEYGQTLMLIEPA